MDRRDLVLYELGYHSDYDMAEAYLSELSYEDHNYNARETLDLKENYGFEWEDFANNGSGMYATMTFDVSGAKALEEADRRPTKRAPAKKRASAKKTPSNLVFLPAD